MRLLVTVKIKSHLSPQKTAEAQQHTPEPLLQGQRKAAERFASKLHNDKLQDRKHGKEFIFSGKLMVFATNRTHLHDDGSQNDGAEDGIPEDAVEHVPLPVDLASVEFVEDLHQDKRVEHNGVVLGGGRVEGGVSATVDVKDLLTFRKIKASKL